MTDAGIKESFNKLYDDCYQEILKIAPRAGEVKQVELTFALLQSKLLFMQLQQTTKITMTKKELLAWLDEEMKKTEQSEENSNL